MGFNVEFDALEGIGHACGHNLIAVAGCAGAVAAAAVMEREGFGGRIVVFGTPAEEGWSLFLFCSSSWFFGWYGGLHGSG